MMILQIRGHIWAKDVWENIGMRRSRRIHELERGACAAAHRLPGAAFFFFECGSANSELSSEAFESRLLALDDLERDLLRPPPLPRSRRPGGEFERERDRDRESDREPDLPRPADARARLSRPCATTATSRCERRAGEFERLRERERERDRLDDRLRLLDALRDRLRLDDRWLDLAPFLARSSGRAAAAPAVVVRIRPAVAGRCGRAGRRSSEAGARLLRREELTEEEGDSSRRLRRPPGAALEGRLFRACSCSLLRLSLNSRSYSLFLDSLIGCPLFGTKTASGLRTGGRAGARPIETPWPRPPKVEWRPEV